MRMKRFLGSFGGIFNPTGPPLPAFIAKMTPGFFVKASRDEPASDFCLDFFVAVEFFEGLLTNTPEV